MDSTTVRYLLRTGHLELVDHPSHRPGKVLRVAGDILRSLTPDEYAAVAGPTPADFRAARERACADLRGRR